MHASAPAADLGRTDDRLGLPVAALGEHLGPAGEDQRERRVLVEPGDEMDRFERRDHRDAVGERIEGALLALAETLRRGIAVDRDQKRRPQGAGLGEIGDVTAMQDVEHAVGEHEWAPAGSEPRRKLLRRADFLFERGPHRGILPDDMRSFLLLAALASAPAFAACPPLIAHTFPSLTDQETPLCQFEGKVVLGFPANDFGGQEPGSNRDIAKFCEVNYGVSFPMFAKSGVLEGNANPFYKTLAAKTGERPQWNFHKYLIDRSGEKVLSFGSAVEPGDRRLVGEIERMLAAPAR